MGQLTQRQKQGGMALFGAIMGAIGGAYAVGSWWRWDFGVALVVTVLTALVFGMAGWIYES